MMVLLSGLPATTEYECGGQMGEKEKCDSLTIMNKDESGDSEVQKSSLLCIVWSHDEVPT